MNIVSLYRIDEFLTSHPDAKQSFALWRKIALTTDWNAWEELEKTYPHVEKVRHFTVFRIDHGNYYLVTSINYKRRKIFIRKVLKAADYDPQNL